MENRSDSMRWATHQGADQGLCHRLGGPWRPSCCSRVTWRKVKNYGFPLRSSTWRSRASFVGALLGGMLVFLFSAFGHSRSGQGGLLRHQRGAAPVQGESRDPPGTEKPDYARYGRPSLTIGSLKMMILPGVLAVGMPIVVGVCVRFASTTAPRWLRPF